MVILSSPSGVGKTTLTKKIQQKYHNFKISVSSTTRSPRSNEVEGVDYHFISHKKFSGLIAKKKFYEYAKIFNNYYGTLKENVDQLILNNDIIFDIEIISKNIFHRDLVVSCTGNAYRKISVIFSKRRINFTTSRNSFDFNSSR